MECREGVDGFAAYRLKCNDCGEEFGVCYEGDVGVSWWN
jgi:hypothetical protein